MPFTSNIVSSNPAQVRCTTLCDKDCQLLATGQWFSLGSAVSSTNEITEILLKVVLSTINVTPIFGAMFTFGQCLWLCLYFYDSSQQLSKQDDEDRETLLHNPLN